MRGGGGVRQSGLSFRRRIRRTTLRLLGGRRSGPAPAKSGREVRSGSRSPGHTRSLVDAWTGIAAEELSRRVRARLRPSQVEGDQLAPPARAFSPGARGVRGAGDRRSQSRRRSGPRPRLSRGSSNRVVSGGALAGERGRYPRRASPAGGASHPRPPSSQRAGAVTSTRLDARLDTPLLDPIAVGGGTALFLKGTCAVSDGRRIARLSVVLDGTLHAVMGHGVSARRAGGGGEMWWGIVSLAPVTEPAERGLSLHAEFADGGSASVELGTMRLEPALGIEQVAAPAEAEAASRPLIAVCMATFEPPLELFARQIESIRAQTYPNWICVISDDCSSPDRLAEVRRVLGEDKRLVLVPADRRLGFYKNFERALALAPAEARYIGLADQDDRWHPDKLEVLAEELDAGAVLAYSDTRVIDEEGRELSDTYWRYRSNNHTDLTSLLITNSITGAAALFRRELAEAALPFPPPHGDIFHDHWLALVAMVTGDIRYVDRPLYDYVQHSGAAIGFVNANAGRGRWGGRLGDMAMRMARL